MTVRAFWLLGLTVGGLAGGPALAEAAPVSQAAAGYQPSVVGVYRPDAHPVWGAFERALGATGRVSLVAPRPPGGGSGAFTAAMAALARPGVRTFVLEPSFSMGALATTEPETQEQSQGGGSTSYTVTVALALPLHMRATLREVGTGRVVEQVASTVTLTRPVSYSYTRQTPKAEVRRLASEAAQRLELQRARPPQDVFADELAASLDDLAERVAEELVRRPTFRLIVPIARLEPAQDRVYLGLGRNVRLRWDDGFRVIRGGQQIGFVKVRELGDGVSAAQPLYVKAPFAVGDRLEEDDQVGIHGGLRLLGGLLPMSPGALSAPALGAGLALEADVAPYIPTSEMYVTASGVGLWSPGGAVGGMVDAGLARRFFVRQTAYKLAAKGAVAVTGAGLLPGGGLGLGVEHHLHEYVQVSAELEGLAWQVPGGWAVGPLARVGMTLMF